MIAWGLGWICERGVMMMGYVLHDWLGVALVLG